MKTLFATTVTVQGGRDGRAVAEDGKLDVALAFPTALGGSGAGTNPEQLFAAGFAACFASSLSFAAKGMGLDAGAVSVVSEVRLTVDGSGAYGIAADLRASVPGLTEAEAEVVLAEAKRICAYSNALAGKATMSVALA
jgi:Ohr subfamily peroxiredoxin